MFFKIIILWLFCYMLDSTCQTAKNAQGEEDSFYFYLKTSYTRNLKSNTPVHVGKEVAGHISNIYLSSSGEMFFKLNFDTCYCISKESFSFKQDLLYDIFEINFGQSEVNCIEKGDTIPINLDTFD